jgi:hypothetical protein
MVVNHTFGVLWVFDGVGSKDAEMVLRSSEPHPQARSNPGSRTDGAKDEFLLAAAAVKGREFLESDLQHEWRCNRAQTGIAYRGMTTLQFGGRFPTGRRPLHHLAAMSYSLQRGPEG